MNEAKVVRWLRACYWVGAVADAISAVLMLFPKLGAVVFGMTDFEPGPDHRYAMGLGASLMVGWTVLLLWADRRPVERSGILAITVCPVITGIALATGYMYTAGLVPLANVAGTWVFQACLTLLFLLSYRAARRLPRHGTPVAA